MMKNSTLRKIGYLSNANMVNSSMDIYSDDIIHALIGKTLIITV